MSKLLLKDQPLLVLPALAVKVGVNGALFLQQLHYWLEKRKRPGRIYVGIQYQSAVAAAVSVLVAFNDSTHHFKA